MTAFRETVSAQEVIFGALLGIGIAGVIYAVIPR